MEATPHHQISLLLDKLTLNLLHLMEEELKCKINIENASNSGSVQLAKCRYIMGQQYVSSLQLPAENSQDFTATRKLEKKDDANISKVSYSDYSDESAENMVNPTKWFGILVPQNLHQAQTLFNTAINYVIDCANVQIQLQCICDSMRSLRILKEKYKAEE